MAKNEAKIKFVAETSEFNSEIKDANNELSKLRAELKQNEAQMDNAGRSAEGLEKKHELLESQLKASRTKVEALAGKVEAATRIYGENSEEVSKLERQLANARTEEAKIEKAISECNDELKEQKSWFAKVSKAAGDTEEGFTVAKGAFADLASNAIQAAIGKVSEFIGYLAELPEATRELRQDMATLETSFESAGLTTEQATDTWKELYRVFGEDDRAVEAANLIAKMSDNQQDLSDWVTITTGIFGTYQDSLPVEGLAEASNETAKTGQVTGVLADALNWSSEAASMFSKYMSEDVTTAEDAFNEALKECTTEEERQALITETLTALYGDAAAKYEEASGSQLDAKEAAAEATLAQNNLANAIEPVTTAYEGLKTQLITAVTPAFEKICGGLEETLGWLQEHPTVLKAVTTFVSVLAIGLGALAIAAGIYTAAQWAMNSAILASPVTWIIVAVIAGIALLAAGIVVLVEKWDQIKAACISAWEGIKSTLAGWGEWISTNVIQPVKNFFSGLWDSITSACSTAWETIKNAVQVAIMFIGSLISAAFQIITLPFRFIWENCKGIILEAWEGIKSAVSTALNAVRNAIQTAWNAVVMFLAPILNAIKIAVTTAWNAIKTAVSTAVNNVKTTVSNVFNAVKAKVSEVWNGVKSTTSTVWNNIKSSVSNVVNGVKSTVSNVFNSIKSTATSVWNGVKNAITKPIEEAKNKVKSVVDAIKGFFSNMKLSLPKIKMPHFKVTGKLSLNPPSVPKLSIDWYKDGGVMLSPTIFGINGNRVMAGGEAGPEAIAPISTLQSYIMGAVERAQQTFDVSSLAAAIEDLANRPAQFYIGDREVALATASASDSVNGLRNTFKTRGLIVD